MGRKNGRQPRPAASAGPNLREALRDLSMRLRNRNRGQAVGPGPRDSLEQRRQQSREQLAANVARASQIENERGRENQPEDSPGQTITYAGHFHEGPTTAEYVRQAVERVVARERRERPDDDFVLQPIPIARGPVRWVESIQWSSGAEEGQEQMIGPKVLIVGGKLKDISSTHDAIAIAMSQYLSHPMAIGNGAAIFFMWARHRSRSQNVMEIAAHQYYARSPYADYCFDSGNALCFVPDVTANRVEPHNPTHITAMLNRVKPDVIILLVPSRVSLMVAYSAVKAGFGNIFVQAPRGGVGSKAYDTWAKKGLVSKVSSNSF